MSETTTIPIQEVLARYQAGESLRDLGKVCGCFASTIARRLRRIGAPRRSVGRYRRELSADVVQLYREGLSLKQIEARSGLAASGVNRRLKKAGVALRPRGGAQSRKWFCNDHYFDVIDTEDKAYWLGFLLADGCVRWRDGMGELYLSLKLEDKAHVEKFAAAISSNGPVRLTHRGRAWTFIIHSNQLVTSLTKLECKPQKTCNHGTPQLREDLYRHFYRGYTDGDGCWSYNKKTKQWGYWVVGALNFLQQQQQWMSQQIGIPIPKPWLKGRAARIGYGGRLRVLRIAELLYADATVYLERKHQKYLEMCQST